MLFLRNAYLCISFAMQNFSVPSLGTASQLPNVSMPCGSTAYQLYAIPSLFYAMLFLHKSFLRFSSAERGFSIA